MKLNILNRLLSRNSQIFEMDCVRLYSNTTMGVASFVHFIVVFLYTIWLLVRFITVALLAPIEYLLRGIDFIYPDLQKNKRINNIKKLINNHAIKLHGYYPTGYYLEDYTHDKNLSLDEFVERFIKLYSRQYDTKEPTSIMIVCGPGRRRSLGDTYLICKTYYPKCTIHDVLKSLVNLLESGEIAGSYCNTINKYVYHTQSDHYNRTDEVEYVGIANFREIIDVYGK